MLGSISDWRVMGRLMIHFVQSRGFWMWLQRLVPILMVRRGNQWRVGQWVIELDAAGRLLGPARISAIEWRLLSLDNGRFYDHDGRSPWAPGERTPCRVIPMMDAQNRKS
jgi:hypothetical protein